MTSVVVEPPPRTIFMPTQKPPVKIKSQTQLLQEILDSANRTTAQLAELNTALYGSQTLEDLGTSYIIHKAHVAAELVIPVPADQIWAVRDCRVIFTADANIANRTFELQFKTPFALGVASDQNDFWTSSLTPNMTASLDWNVFFLPNWPIAETTFRSPHQIIHFPLPGQTQLLPGCTIETLTNSIQAGDFYLFFADLHIWKLKATSVTKVV